MYSVWVTLRIQPGREEHFRAAIEKNATASVRDEPGCLSFDVIRLGTAENSTFAFYEVYESADAFHHDHRTTAHYAEWKDAVSTDVVPGSQVVTTGDRLLHRT